MYSQLLIKGGSASGLRFEMRMRKTKSIKAKPRLFPCSGLHRFTANVGIGIENALENAQAMLKHILKKRPRQQLALASLIVLNRREEEKEKERSTAEREKKDIQKPEEAQMTRKVVCFVFVFIVFLNFNEVNGVIFYFLFYSVETGRYQASRPVR
jgi:hypothetical protein